MKRMPFAVGIAAIVVLAGCTQPAEQAEKASGDETAAVGQVRDAWAAAWKTGSGAQLAALYAEDAVHMDNHAPTANGRAAIETMFTNQFAEMAPGDITITSEKVDIDGDLAYDRGTWQITVTPKAGGAPVSDGGRYIAISKKQADGSWKIVEGIANSATPLPVPPPPARPAQ